MVEPGGAGGEQPSAVDVRASMDRVGDGFVTLDRNWDITFVNAAAARLLGRDGGALEGKNLWEEFPTAVGSPLERQYREAMATQTLVEFEQQADSLGAWLSIRVYPSPEGLTVVFRDVTRLHALLEERQALLERLLQAEDRERARIAADIHDDSAQELVVVALRLDLLRAHLGEPSPLVAELLDSVCEQVRSATTRLRNLLFSLEPTDNGATLAEAIRAHASHVFEDSVTVWSVEEVAPGPELPGAERSQALRIVKEALNNVYVHAQASEVVVTVSGGDDGTEVAVVDNGTTMDPSSFSSAPGHRGLATMRDRAEAVGGWCVLEPTVPHGCTVRLFVPTVHHRQPGPTSRRGGD